MDYIDIYRTMVLSRTFEEYVESLFKRGLLYGTTHLSIGQEASETGLIKGLDIKKDYIVPTHRNHIYALSSGIEPYALFSELLGSIDGCCHGLGGSMHLFDKERHIMPSTAIVGSGASISSGVAFDLKTRGEDGIAVAILGDGAMNRGSLYETMNLSSLFSLPLLFYVVNNHYGMSSPDSLMIQGPGITKRAEAFGIDAERVDGNDIFSVIESVKRARGRILSNKRPYLLEMDTYRQNGHSKSDNLEYRTREEEALWLKRDPIKRLEASLLSEHLLSEKEILSIQSEVFDYVDSSYKRALEKRVSLTLGNTLDLVYPTYSDHIYDSYCGGYHIGSYREGIREALVDELENNRRAYLIGEEIGLYGGAFSVTKGLIEKFPDRVIDTPVSEEGITGLSTGAAMMGSRMILELMYGDFLTLSSDGIVNHAAKVFYITGGELKCPLTVRVPFGGGTGHGLQHSQSLESMFMNIPGLKILAPSDPNSAKNLLKEALSDEGPVLFFEHKALYDKKSYISDGYEAMPIGTGKYIYGGDRLLVIGYSYALYKAREALSELPISFFDLRSLRPLDEQGILFFSSFFENVLIIEETSLLGSVAESVARILIEGYEGEVDVLSGLDTPIPFNRELESEVILSEEKIRSKALDILRKNGSMIALWHYDAERDAILQERTDVLLYPQKCGNESKESKAAKKLYRLLSERGYELFIPHYKNEVFTVMARKDKERLIIHIVLDSEEERAVWKLLELKERGYRLFTIRERESQEEDGILSIPLESLFPL